MGYKEIFGLLPLPHACMFICDHVHQQKCEVILRNKFVYSRNLPKVSEFVSTIHKKNIFSLALKEIKYHCEYTY